MTAASYDRSVFINCPFDAEYEEFFRALVFAVHDSGYVSRCSLEVEDSGEVRMAKLTRIIGECRHGIHDLSRIETEPTENLPRFNMPLELGLFLGARAFGPGRQKAKRTLILDKERFLYRKFCSDIAGQDVKAHEGSVEYVIRGVRNWLSTAYDGTVLIPSAPKAIERYHHFMVELPGICSSLLLHPQELQFVELRTLIEEWVDQNRP